MKANRIVFLAALLFSSALAQDSSKTNILGIRPHWLQLAPLRLSGDSLHLQFKRPDHVLKVPGQFYDLKRVMPENKMLWDYRESSYYTPLWVRNKMARIMNRPGPGEVLPLFPLALIAARLALQQMEINKKIAIKPQDYLIDRKYWPILKALWDRSPQSAEQLYAIKEISRNRTLNVLKQDLQFLVNQKLLKRRMIPGEDTLYFVAQSRGQALLLLKNALQNDQFTMPQKMKFLELKNYLSGEGD